MGRLRLRLRITGMVIMRPIRHDLILTIASVVVIAGLMGLLFDSFLQAQEYPADITRGKGVYERHCQACHGIAGWGDGPDAQALKVPPTNFHRFLSFLK